MVSHRAGLRENSCWHYPRHVGIGVENLYPKSLYDHLVNTIPRRGAPQWFHTGPGCVKFMYVVPKAYSYLSGKIIYEIITPSSSCKHNTKLGHCNVFLRCKVAYKLFEIETITTPTN